MKKVFKKLIHTFIFSCMLTSSLFGANIIFDLGGVLIDTNKMAAFKQFGLGRILSYTLKGNKPANIKKKFFEVLNKIDTTEQTLVKDHDNDILPKLMCDWMNGTQTAEQLLNTVTDAINNNPEWFSSTVEKDLVQTLTRMIFSTKHFVRTRKLIKNSVKFVKECKKQGHKCYILSNWNTESFAYMREKKEYKKLFDLFDGILISGEHKCLKPESLIYFKLIRQFKLNPNECIFIDDQKENIDAAKKMDIHAIQCKSGKPDFKRIQAKINKWGQVPQKKQTNQGWLSLLNKSWVGYLAGFIVFSSFFVGTI